MSWASFLGSFSSEALSAILCQSGSGSCVRYEFPLCVMPEPSRGPRRSIARFFRVCSRDAFQFHDAAGHHDVDEIMGTVSF